MLTVIAGIIMFIIGWQLSRRYMRWQIKRDQPTIADAQTVDRATLYKIAEECITMGWRAAMNGFSINYFEETEDRPWYTGFFKTITHNKQEHVFYMKEYTVEGGLVDISAVVPADALHKTATPNYLPEGDYQ